MAFRRPPIAHPFRLAKREAGFAHFEGRNYRALMRRLTKALVVMGSVRGKHLRAVWDDDFLFQLPTRKPGK